MKATLTLQNNPTISWNMQKNPVENKTNFYLIPIFLHCRMGAKKFLQLKLCPPVSPFLPILSSDKHFRSGVTAVLLWMTFEHNLDINRAGLTNISGSRNSVWHNSLRKKTASVPIHSFKSLGSKLNGGKSFITATKLDLSELKLFYFRLHWPAIVDSPKLFLVIYSLQ